MLFMPNQLTPYLLSQRTALSVEQLFDVVQRFARILEYRCSCVFLTGRLNFSAFYEVFIHKMLKY